MGTSKNRLRHRLAPPTLQLPQSVSLGGLHKAWIFRGALIKDLDSC